MRFLLILLPLEAFCVCRESDGSSSRNNEQSAPIYLEYEVLALPETPFPVKQLKRNRSGHLRDRRCPRCADWQKHKFLQSLGICSD